MNHIITALTLAEGQMRAEISQMRAFNTDRKSAEAVLRHFADYKQMITSALESGEPVTDIINQLNRIAWDYDDAGRTANELFNERKDKRKKNRGAGLIIADSMAQRQAAKRARKIVENHMN